MWATRSRENLRRLRTPALRRDLCDRRVDGDDAYELSFFSHNRQCREVAVDDAISAVTRSLQRLKGREVGIHDFLHPLVLVSHHDVAQTRRAAQRSRFVVVDEVNEMNEVWDLQ